MHTERRRALRLPVRLAAHARTGATETPVEVVNLSRRGLLVKGQPAPLGSEISVRVDLLDGSVDLPGEIVRVVSEGNAPHTGIRFTRLEPQVRRELANYVIKRHYSAHA
jgi:c-di-GMP-binding flagellar brake protein YcgR